MPLDFCVMYPMILCIHTRPGSVLSRPPQEHPKSEMIGGRHVSYLVLPLIADFSNLRFSPNHVKFQVSLRCCPKYSEALSGTQ